jgi:uncharacterized FAD-dependent dehydrogenase
MDKKYDVIIIGAGPAGLAAAFELTALSKLSVLLIDKGSSIEHRKCSSLEKLCSDHSTCSITHGSGGAGLYSDGKLCLDPAIGSEDISKFYNQTETAELMKRVIDLLCLDSLPLSSPKPNQKAVAHYQKAFGEAGLAFTHYPVVRLGLQERLKQVASIENYLKQHGV